MVVVMVVGGGSCGCGSGDVVGDGCWFRRHFTSSHAQHPPTPLHSTPTPGLHVLGEPVGGGDSSGVVGEEEGPVDELPHHLW